MAYTWVKNFEEISSSKYLVEAEMSESAPANTDQIIIKLCDDTTVAGGAWELHKLSNNVYEVHASDYYGYTAASKYFKTYVKNNKASEAPLPAPATGTICDDGMLTRAEESSKYAFEKTGSIRVMFNNILWDDPMFSQRELYNAELFSVYMPDVLGLQEVNAGRRGNVEDGKGGIIARLAALGYEEAVDPRVKNYYAKNEKIPGTDASLTTDTTEHVELNGYGTGGTKVTVNGETFYTAYNCTPLLYNTATTKLIAAEYYWYKNQWDKRTGQSHDNGAGDCASKAATWGLFEDLATGERYIAISTHMCTRSDYIRGLQGQEMVALINELIETYNVPVILGGDYNGTIKSANYLAFVEGGLENVQLDKLASVYTSPATSHHTYPVYDQDTKLVVPDKGDTAGATNASNNIDHIMVKNHENMEINVFGVVVDEMSKSGADHLPIFMDFSITSKS